MSAAESLIARRWLAGGDVQIVLDAIRVRERMKREIHELSNAKLAKKFGVSYAEIMRVSAANDDSARVRKAYIAPRPGTLRARLLDVLSEGPSTSAEASSALCVPIRRVVRAFHDLVRYGIVVKRPFRTSDNPLHPMVMRYSLPEHRL